MRVIRFETAVWAVCVAAVALAVSAVVAIAPSVVVGAQPGPGPNGSFYDIPGPPPADAHGTLLYYEPTSSSQIKGAAGYDIAYVSTAASGAPDVVTGSLWIPTSSWNGAGQRPLVSYAVGTQGMGEQCAPSKQLAAGSEYDAVGINEAVGAGYAVVVTDYQWLGTTDTPPAVYMVGLSQGYAVLDAAIAASQLPGVGISARAPVVTWGYSQGGNATIEAAQLWPNYDPSVNLVGDASGGVPGNIVDTTTASNASLGTGFLLDALIGFNSAYPNLPFNSVFNSTGQALIAKLKEDCLVGDLLDAAFANLDTLTNGGITLSQLYSEGSWDQDLLANSVGLTGAHIEVPVFNYRADVDEIIPTSVEDTVYANLCATGTTVEAATYPGEHLLTDYEAVGDVLNFIGKVTTGQSIFDSCNISKTSLYQG